MPSKEFTKANYLTTKADDKHSKRLAKSIEILSDSSLIKITILLKVLEVGTGNAGKLS